MLCDCGGLVEDYATYCVHFIIQDRWSAMSLGNITTMHSITLTRDQVTDWLIDRLLKFAIEFDIEKFAFSITSRFQNQTTQHTRARVPAWRAPDNDKRHRRNTRSSLSKLILLSNMYSVDFFSQHGHNKKLSLYYYWEYVQIIIKFVLAEYFLHSVSINQLQHFISSVRVTRVGWK